MKNLRKQDGYWKPCRPGTILSVSDSKFRRQRREFLIQSTMASVVAGAGVFSAIFVLVHRKDLAVADGDEVSNISLASSKSQSSTLPEPVASHSTIRLTCRDIKDLTGEYVSAVQLTSAKRTAEQLQLIADFGQHLHVCPGCTTMVLKAIQEV